MDGNAFLAALSSGGAVPGVQDDDAAAAPAPSGKSAREAAGASSSASGSNSEWIQFNGVLDSFPIRGPEVTIVPFYSGDHDRGSSKLKLKNVVNCAWQHSYHAGQLVAAHPVGAPAQQQLLAYAIVTPGAKREGVVRVTHRKTGERTLLKGMTGKVKDLAFARTHGGGENLLGVVDEVGNLFVFSVVEDAADGNRLKTSLVLHIRRPEAEVRTASPDDVRRIIWCPYLPDPEDEDEDDDGPSTSPAKLLVVTRNETAEIWNLETVTTAHGGPGPHDPSSVREGRLVIRDHGAPIVDATFSPDGTALATASADGQVKFFQVYMHSAGGGPDGGGGERPRCLHEWAPHGGRPLSSLFFLDDHRLDVRRADEQFWKYAVTGCDRNSELKVWSCESWTCLQTIRFRPPKSEAGAGKDVALKAALDLSAKFMLLSDINRKNVYVLQLHETKEKGTVFGSVSEFATPSSFLSMVVTSAGPKGVGANKNGRGSAADNGKRAGGDRKDRSGSHLNSGDSDDFTDGDSDSVGGDSDVFTDEDLEDASPATGSGATSNNGHSRSPSFPPGEDAAVAVAASGSISGSSNSTCCIDLVLVQPKSLQECRITYDDALQTVLAASRLSSVAKEQEEDTMEDDDAGDDDNVVEVADDSLLIKTEPNNGVVKVEPADDPQVKAIKSEPKSPSTASAKSELKAAADKITLMSPDAFASKAPKVKQEPVAVVKQEPLDDDDIVVAGVGVRNCKLVGVATGRSGASSPSREVRDILGDSEDLGEEVVITEEPYDEDEDDEEDDELVNIGDEEDDQDGAAGGGAKDDMLANAAKAALSITDPGIEEIRKNAGSGVAKSLLNKTGDWPGIPKIKQEAIDDDPAVVAVPVSAPVVAGAGVASGASLDEVMSTLGQMTRLIQNQQKEIRTLGEDVRQLKKTAAGGNDQAQSHLLDKFIKRSGQQLNDALRRDAKARADAAGADAGKVEQAVAQEVRKIAPQASHELAKTVTAVLESDLRQRTGKADAALRDAVQRLAHHKALPDQLAHSVAQSLQQALQQELRDCVCNVLAPAVERAMKEMLQQVSARIQQGLKEHESKLQTHMTQVRDETHAKILAPLAQELREQTAQAARASHAAQERLVAAVREAAASEMRSAAIHIAAASSSPATVPASPMGQVSTAQQPSLEDLKRGIRSHVGRGQFEEAFQVALSANSLALVVATCKTVDAAVIFDEGGCVLSQPILLALIQQLSHDLHEETQTKHRYLEEAVMSLDSGDPATRHHLVGVLGGLKQQLTRFVASGVGGGGASARQMKMLLLATNQMLANYSSS